jgi:molybdenum cofactor cytidylyltransferase
MISAIVLAAGLSTRMGQPKLILPWGSSTVIGSVVETLLLAGVNEIVVVTGGARYEVEKAIREISVEAVRTVFNPRYVEDNMLLSLQAGMSVLGEHVQAFLVALGDQPQIEIKVARALVGAYQARKYPLLVPSYAMRRGHPWVVDRSMWDAILSAPDGSTMRDFLNAHQERITYLQVDSPSILRDLDTPEDYAQGLTGSASSS